MTKIKKKTTKM
jgi:hypothetical protein